MFRNFYKEERIDCGMKKVFVVLSFLFLIGFASSMNGPIRVMTPEPETRASVIIWDVDDGYRLNDDSGVSDEAGIFTTKTFFSLASPYKITVWYKGIPDSFEEEVNGTEFDNGIDIDCTVGRCFASASVVVPEIVDVEELTVNEINETNESMGVIEEDNVSEVGNKSVLMTGGFLFFGENGSFNWFFSVGGFVALLFLLVFIVVISRRRRVKKIVLDDEDKELVGTEKKVKETEEKIKKIKEEKVKKFKIYEAKLKLAREERELMELEGKKVEAQGEVTGVKDIGRQQIDGDKDKFGNEFRSSF